jgi:hypothetical protein
MKDRNEPFLRDAYDAASLRRPGHMWHVLRHTYASVRAKGGIRRDVVERLMGHAGKGTTSIYTHLFGMHATGLRRLSTPCSESTSRQRSALSLRSITRHCSLPDGCRVRRDASIWSRPPVHQ